MLFFRGGWRDTARKSVLGGGNGAWVSQNNVLFVFVSPGYCGKVFRTVLYSLISCWQVVRGSAQIVLGGAGCGLFAGGINGRVLGSICLALPWKAPEKGYIGIVGTRRRWSFCEISKCPELEIQGTSNAPLLFSFFLFFLCFSWKGAW